MLKEHSPTDTIYKVTVAQLPGQHDENERLQLSWEYFEGDVLFVHRDAEKETLAVRQAQIDVWVTTVFKKPPPYVRVVPVRMTEAWLLLNEAAIREAAGNPNGSVRLSLPVISRLELLPDPKEVLLELLRQATGNTGRRLRYFNARQAIHRLADLQQEYGFHALRALPAFAALEAEVAALVQTLA
ncbi:hypothetical protein [Hymenobacter aranciens]|uniref:hypothetical protein n=1 Tax=Hymenobacter aranciens TaxID=3063996 RepID=UPI00272D7075|nr:hypothetical protein [Hymenobacter sp. ASUV-10]